MNFGIRVLVVLLSFCLPASLQAKSLDEFVKQAAINNGLVQVDKLNPSFDKLLATIGKTIFNSKSLSFNGQISCQTCHLDKFGSADGIPNAIGIGGVGEGKDRIINGGAVIPRNTLPLWGRGATQFRTFFWDGKVDFSNGRNISQFGFKSPSRDPLIVSIHLPVVEIREMLSEDRFIGSQKREKVEAAEKIYAAVLGRLIADHEQEMKRLAEIRNKPLSSLTFLDIAVAIQQFIRQKFAVKSYKFSRFVFDNGPLGKAELAGAALFYGKGKCSLCHSGPLFSDLNFYVIPFSQLGSGKNGFGVDYGRFNVTHNPADIYKFRIPPLLNVTKTAPYGHSGSVATLEEAITRHFDPLKYFDPGNLSARDRIELYKKIVASSQQLHTIATLDDNEIRALVDFLRTFEF